MGMSIISKSRRQKAVYWPKLVSDGMGGFITNNPVEIDCRWDDETTLVVTADSKEAVSGATVYVDRDMVQGEFLLLGRMDSLPSKDVRPMDVGARMILTFSKNPVLRVRQDGLDPDANEYLRTAKVK